MLELLNLERRSGTRIIIYVLAATIIGGSLLYSNFLAERLSEKEAKAIKRYTDAIDFVGNFDQPSEDDGMEEARIAIESMLGFIIEQQLSLDESSEIPLILVGEQDTSYNNLKLSEDPKKRASELTEYITGFRQLHDSIRVEYVKDHFQYVYYGESFILRRLRWFPVIQLLVAFGFIGVVFVGFVIAKRNEQNRVWVGLAKETAHQLGTPVSSLMAWTELLRMKAREGDEEMIQEIEKDVKRLETITERFSKIGSKPELVPINLDEFLRRSAEYISKRMTRRGSIQVKVENELAVDSFLSVNPQLFDWVIENLLKNALDAIQTKEGEIIIRASRRGAQYFIDVSDTGKGISKGNFKKVFEPGFTTKKRGWGLGLSLTKRIVENYHKGSVFVKASELGKGTTFRIQLPV
ncbi:MAG: HAMP domain-containing sensor histidine kinase [Bacteroidota bacterium]